MRALRAVLSVLPGCFLFLGAGLIGPVIFVIVLPAPVVLILPLVILPAIPGTLVFFATPGTVVIRLPLILLAFVSMDPEVLRLVSLPLVGR